jgi:methylenetetrahydrofolate reductase (NADPH)
MATAAIMEGQGQAQQAALASLFADFSLEMTAKDIEQLEAAANLIPTGSVVSVTFLPGEEFSSRVDAAAAVARLGLRPVPHISARRIRSEGELEGFLDRLAERIELRHVFVVGGDLPEPAGPYRDALAVIRSGLLEKYGVRHVGIAGYAEGHPEIGRDMLDQALRDKVAEARARGFEASVMTQFGFDADPILDWIERIRGEGIVEPVRIGVAGPASIKTLLRFATRCGVGASASVLRKYGLSLTRLVGSAGPDPILADLADGLRPAVHGDTRLHFYPFGGFVKTAEWISQYRSAQGV